MSKIISTLINKLSEKPKTLFQIDSLGAMLTTFFLFVIIRQLNEYFGISITIVTCLSLIAIGFCIYSTTYFLFLKRRQTAFVRIIGIANAALLYPDHGNTD